MTSMFAIASYFQEAKPLKTSKLHEKFLSDLLTRYVSLYIRIGSPDFEGEMIKQMLEEI